MTADYRDALQEFHSAFIDKFFGNDTGLPPRLIKACNEAGEVLCRKPQPEPLPTHDLSSSAPLLWLLWNHLGAHSPVGQPIREYLGLGQFERMSDAQIGAANQYRSPLRPTPQPPADGEVAELVRYGVDWNANPLIVPMEDGYWTPWHIAADLLQHQHPHPHPHPVPVPVSERQPGPEHCDRWGECWTTDYDPSLAYTPVWKMTELPRQDLGHNFSNAYFWRNVKFWLPANALPTP